MFDDIRPYQDREVAPVITKLQESEEVRKILSMLIPEREPRALLYRMRDVNSVEKFQEKLMVPLIEYIIEKSTDSVHLKGVADLDPKGAYLFISNHRDIFLDSAFLGLLLHRKGFSTPEMAIGDNLMMNPWITHLFKLNRTVIVKRGLSKREIFKSSQHLSAYIFQLLQKTKHSFWLAQQEGRAKTGNDMTHSGVIKMLSLAGGKNPAEHLQKLNIMPVSISYEYDPCDILKAQELYQLETVGSYEKKAGEDLNSITRGVFGAKGRVQIIVGQPLNQKTHLFDNSIGRHELVDHVCLELDKEILKNYHLWPSNHIAYDLLYQKPSPGTYYTEEDLDFFTRRLDERLQNTAHQDEVKKLLLSMYANPVVNLLRITQNKI